MNPNPEPTPSSEPVTPPPATPVAQPVVHFIRTQRQNAAYVLLALSVVFLGLTIYLAVKGFKGGGATAAEVKPPEPENPFELPETPKETANLGRGDYMVGWVGTLFGFLVTAASGMWLLAGLPAPTEERQRTEARAVVLTVGGLLGVGLLVVGAWYFYRWSDSLTKWLDKGETKEMRWVVIPLLMVAAGAGLLAVSVQPARAEERNNSTIRRLVYGSNLALSVLLLFVALVVANVFVGLRVPNRLDTTETGFYSLSPTTTEFLANLDQPVTAYAILSGNSRATSDIRRLLENAADVPGTKFKARFVSPVADKAEIRELKAKYPELELNDTGVLLAVGEDGKRHSFLREDEFTESSMGPRRGGGAFVGETRLMRELLFLAENKQRAVIYFTQSAGELDIGAVPGRRVSPSASGARLKAYIEKNYLDIKPLTFELENPKVPDDADMVIVAEPQIPLTEGAVGAIRKYMSEPRPNGKKGKLLVMASARFGPDDKVIKTGLEPLLAEFHIQMADRLVLSWEMQDLGADTPIVMFSPAAIEGRNPVAVTLGEKVVFLGKNWRPVSAVQTPPTQPGMPAVRATPLLSTMDGRPTWLEETRPGPGDLNQIIVQLRSNASVRQAKQLTTEPRDMAAIASEGDTGRVAVIGNGTLVADTAVERSRSGSLPITFEMVAGLIDWLRDRPPVGEGIESKKYKEYTFPAVTDETRILFLPLGLAMLVVVGLGAGVWVIRRK